jgi:hypothetical protein
MTDDPDGLRPLTEHSPNCSLPGWEWQQRIIPGLPIRGRCRGCGALIVQHFEDRKTQ